MDRKLNKRIAEYIGDFKKQIKEKTLNLRFTDTEKVQELMEFVFQYDRLVLSKEDVSKRKRVKNSIPCNNRCHAKRANGEQCTRKQKDGFTYCGTHIKGIPHGIVSTNTGDDSQYINAEVIAEEINGIVYYLDKHGNIFSTEDVLKQTPNPKVIAKYKKDGDQYIIYRTTPTLPSSSDTNAPATTTAN
jgi:hypothetical protein